MEDKAIAIQINGIKKRYKLGQIGGRTLQADIQSWWARKLGKEDPNTKIGQDQRLVGQTFMALNGIDLTICQGEAVGIIGANGAGKSTLLKLLCRVTAPTEGEIDIYGRIVSMLEVGTGFNLEMTGRENVYMNGAILGMTKEEIDAKIEDIIEFSEVRDFIDTPVKRYSSGMYVKLAFSVAAHLDSEIMIMDEVLAVGDMAFQKKCLTKMREAAKQEGRTVLYVSHNMNTIRQLCDRCIVMDQGKIVFDGDVEEAIQIYMYNDANESVMIDYTNIPRLPWLKNTKIKTIAIRFINKVNNCFTKQELLELEIKWRNEKTVQDLCLRIEFSRIDRTPVGTAFINDFYSGQEEEISTRIFLVDISSFAPGRYIMIITFFEKNLFGNDYVLDCVEGLTFEVLESAGVQWNERSWGSIKLPDIVVKESEAGA